MDTNFELELLLNLILKVLRHYLNNLRMVAALRKGLPPLGIHQSTLSLNLGL